MENNNWQLKPLTKETHLNNSTNQLPCAEYSDDEITETLVDFNCGNPSHALLMTAIKTTTLKLLKKENTFTVQ